MTLSTEVRAALRAVIDTGKLTNALETEMLELVAKIESELRRLDCLDTGNWAGITAEAPTELPLGWVAVGQGGTGIVAYGPGAEVLKALAEAHPVRMLPGELREDPPTLESGWDAAWRALSDFADDAPASSGDWPEDLISTEQVEDGSPNDQPVTLIRIQTNAGERWAIGPHGVFNCALSDAFSHGAFYATREHALASYPDAE